uniref:Uncharacterized protein n=1 Tax=Arundo donax TaxID=35708 RepID=A0A0A9G4M5_ARUDO
MQILFCVLISGWFLVWILKTDAMAVGFSCL